MKWIFASIVASIIFIGVLFWTLNFKKAKSGANFFFKDILED